MYLNPNFLIFPENFSRAIVPPIRRSKNPYIKGGYGGRVGVGGCIGG